MSNRTKRNFYINFYMVILTILGFLGLFTTAGCDSRQHHHIVNKHTKVSEYYQSSGNGNDALYWYIFYSTLNGNTTTYYYSSPTRISDFSNINPTKSGPELPDNVQQSIRESEEMAETQLNESQEPTEITQDQAAFEATYAEYAETQNSIDSESNVSETSVDTSSSSDAGGGSDGGGGGGGD